jgi:hypothetical protein
MRGRSCNRNRSGSFPPPADEQAIPAGTAEGLSEDQIAALFALGMRLA